jgi:hypothetical protein
MTGEETPRPKSYATKTAVELTTPDSLRITAFLTKDEPSFRRDCQAP